MDRTEIVRSICASLWSSYGCDFSCAYHACLGYQNSASLIFHTYGPHHEWRERRLSHNIVPFCYTELKPGCVIHPSVSVPPAMLPSIHKKDRIWLEKGLPHFDVGERIARGRTNLWIYKHTYTHTHTLSHTHTRSVRTFKKFSTPLRTSDSLCTWFPTLTVARVRP